MAMIAGGPTVADVMARLAAGRPVFHSEADFQHAFGQVLHGLAASCGIRLKVPQGHSLQGQVEHLDLLCFGPQGRTAIEFKYFKASWTGIVSAGDGPSTETFELRNHSATDEGRRDYVFDIARLEQLCAAQPGTNGVAIMLSNAQGLWRPPKVAPLTRDREFRIHEGAVLSGTLKWGGGDYPKNTRTLSGSYPMAWQPYSDLPGPRGEFPWVAAEVMPRAPRPTRPGAPVRERCCAPSSTSRSPTRPLRPTRAGSPVPARKRPRPVLLQKFGSRSSACRLTPSRLG
ncbi:MAG: hypothetical protein M3Q47_03970 [Actinomycetota bacterium]|nr:hypothetical protein [Actinomycetota bacterium]